MSVTLPDAYRYTSLERIYETLPQLKTQAVTITTSEVALQAISAEAYVDAKLARLYGPASRLEAPLLSEIATDLTIYKVVVKRLFTPKQLASSPWPDRYKAAEEILCKLADGTLPLTDASGEVITPDGGTSGEVWSDKSGYDPTFFEGRDEFDPVVDVTKIETNIMDRG